jgi:hypothetical protein
MGRLHVVDIYPIERNPWRCGDQPCVAKRRSRHSHSKRGRSRLIRPPSASVGIGRCASPQPSFDSDISDIARLWQAFSFVPNHSQTVQGKTSYQQWLTPIPTSVTKRRQKFHGTKLLQNGTKKALKSPPFSAPISQSLDRFTAMRAKPQSASRYFVNRTSTSCLQTNERSSSPDLKRCFQKNNRWRLFSADVQNLKIADLNPIPATHFRATNPARPSITQRGCNITMSGNAALRHELDEASRIRFPHVYTETLERLRREFGHSIMILPDGSNRIARFNCFAYGLRLWEHDDYILPITRPSSIRNSFVRCWMMVRLQRSMQWKPRQAMSLSISITKQWHAPEWSARIRLTAQNGVATKYIATATARVAF